MQNTGRLRKNKVTIKHYSEVIRLKPDYTEAHFQLGVNLDAKGNLNIAMPYFSEAILLKPSDDIYLAPHLRL